MDGDYVGPRSIARRASRRRRMAGRSSCRPGRARRRHGRSGTGSATWASTGSRTCPCRSASYQAGCQGLAMTSRPSGPSMRPPNNLPAPAHAVRRPGAEVAEARDLLRDDAPRDAHRTGRDRQDPPGAPGRRPTLAAASRTGCGSCPWRRSPSRSWSRPRSPGGSVGPGQAGRRCGRVVEHLRARERCWCWTTSSRWWRRPVVADAAAAPQAQGAGDEPPRRCAIAGEQEFAVPPLPVPRPLAPPPARDRRGARGRAAVPRASDGRPPGFALTAENAGRRRRDRAPPRRPAAGDRAGRRARPGCSPAGDGRAPGRPAGPADRAARDLPGPAADAARRDRLEPRPARRRRAAAAVPPGWRCSSAAARWRRPRPCAG